MLPFQTLLWSSVTRSCFGTDGLLVKILSAEPAMPDSLGTREVIGNPLQTCPIFTGRWRLLGPNPRPHPRYNVLLRLHHRSDANLIRMLAGLRSLPLQARLHRLRRPHLHRFRLLKCSFQSLRLHSRTLRSLWRARAGMHPFPPPLHQLRAQLLSRLRLRTWIPALFRQRSQRLLRRRLRALLREPWKQHRLRSPRRQLKFPPKKFLCHLRRLRRPHLPRQTPSFLPFEFPASSAPSLPHSEASPAQAKSATGEAGAPAHTSAKSPLSSSTDDSDTSEPVASPQDEESSPELKRELPEISSAQDPEDLSSLYKEFLATPKVLSGEVKHHKGTANSPWTCYLPSSLTDEAGRVWYVFGVGGDRATLAPPASLGRAHAHQVLKIGRPDSMTPERKYFALLHRDFNYVTRPVGYGTTTVRLADNARTSTQGFVLECKCVYYQKVAPVDKQLGSQRQLQVPDLLAALAIVAHLSSLYLRVADIGGHNLGWGIEPLAIGAEANHILQERALRHRPYVPLMLFDAGRWRESPAISFPGAKATKGLLGLIERYPDFHSWVLSQIRSYHNAQALCIAFLHRLRQYEAHWEGVMSSGLVTFLPLTLRPGLLIPTRSPWEREEETTWQIVPVFDQATPARVTS